MGRMWMALLTIISIRARPTPSLGRNERSKARAGSPTFIMIFVFGRALPARETFSTLNARRPG
jgi:hypothetical protein